MAAGAYSLANPKPKTLVQTIWPGSHGIVFGGFEEEINPRLNDTYQERLDRARRTITPVEFTGECGDVLFCTPQPAADVPALS